MSEEVRVELKVDDRSQEALKHAEEGFKKVGHEAEKAGQAHGKGHGEGHGEGMREGIMAGFLEAELIKEGVEKTADFIKEKFSEAFEAAEQVFDQKRALTGMMALTGKAGEGFEEMQDQANLFHESLENIGIEAGVSSQAMIDAFSGIAERTGKSGVEVEELTKQMAYAGKAIPGGLSALQGGFEAIEMGVVRARNPIVQMIASTGLLHGNAKQVAAQMMKLTPEKQIELATEAMSKMGEKMKAMPPSMAELKTSFGQIQEKMAASLGEPMLAALIPELDAFKGYLQEHDADIMETRHSIGKFLGEEIHKEAEFFRSVADMWATRSEESEKSMKGGAQFWKDAFDGSLWVVNQIGMILAQAAKGFQYMVGDIMNFFHEKTQGGTFGTSMQESSFNSEAAGLVGKTADPEQKKQMDELLEKMDKAALARTNQGEDTPELAAFEQHIEELRNQAEAQANEGQAAISAVQGVSTNQMLSYYQRAIDNHEEGQKLFIAKLIAGSTDAQDALIKSGEILQNGMVTGLVEAMKDAGQAKAAEAFAEKAKAAASAKGEKAQYVVNISGGIQIHQDFRDQDPDRVVIAMRRDIAKNAENRIAARTGLPFGA